MTLSSETQANTQNKLRRTATWQVTLLLLLFVLMAINTTRLASGTQLWQAPVLAATAILRALITLFGLYQVRQNKVEQATALIIGATSVTFFLTALFTANNIALVLPVIILLSVVFLASGTLSGPPRRRAIIFGVIFAALTGLANFVPLSFRVVAPIQTEALAAVAGVLVIALAYFIIRGYGQYSLSVRLSAGFLVVVLIVTGVVYGGASTSIQQGLLSQVGADRVSVARTQALIIANELTTQLNVLETFTLNSSVQDRLVIAEGAYASVTDVDTVLAEAEANWQAAADLDPIVQSRLTSLLAVELQNFQRAFPGFTELLITDSQGALVAATARPEQYAFADESWWQAAFNEGAGQTVIEEPAETADGNLALTMVVPVLIEERFVGVLHATYSLQRLGELTEASRLGETGVSEIYLPNGLELELEAGAQEIEEAEFAVDALGDSFDEAAFLQTDYDGVPSIVSWAPITAGTDDLAVAELGWVVVFHQHEEEALATLQERLTLVTALLVAVFVVVLFIIVWFSRILVNPINDLIRAAAQIGAGDYSVRATTNTGDELQTLGETFNQMAGQIQQTLEDLQASSLTITTSADISRQLSTILDPALLTSAVVEQLKAAFDYYHAHIYLLDDAGKNLVMAGGTGKVGQALLAQNHQIPLGKGVVGQTALRAQTTLVPDVTQDANWLPNPLLPDTQAELAVPLALGGRLLGVLDVQNDEAYSLGQTDVELLETIAGQVAIGLQNASLFAEREQVMTAMQREQERAEAILESIITPIVISGVADGTVLYVNEPLSQMIRVPRQKLIGEITPDFYANPEDRGPFLAAIREHGMVENYELRLKRGDGDTFWALVSGRVIEFQGQPALLTSLIDISARKAAEAQTTRLANELTTVAEVGVAAATLREPDALLQSVADLTKEGFDLYHTHLFLLNERGDTLVLAAGAGEVGQQMVQEGRRISLNAEQSLVASVARQKSGAIRNYSAEGEGFMPHPLLADTRAEMAVPILLGDDVLGVLDVRATQAGFFGEADMQTYQTLATQVAVALQNARSFARSEQALSELQEMSRRLIRSGWQEFTETLDKQTTYAFAPEEPIHVVEEDAEASFTLVTTDMVQPLAFQDEEIGKLTLSTLPGQAHDVKDIMAAVADRLSVHLENLRLSQQTQQRSAELAILNEMSQTLTAQTSVDGVFQTIYNYLSQLMVVTDFYAVLYEEENNEVIFVLTVSGDKARWYTERRQAGHGVTEYLIRQRQPLLMPENVGEHLAKMGIEGYGNMPESWLGAPILLGERVLGVIGLESYTTPRQFNTQHLNLLTAVANQAAIAIESTRLLEGTVARAEEEQILRQITTRVSTAVDAESILRTAAEEIGRALGLEGFVGLEPVGSGNGDKGSNGHIDTQNEN